MPKASKGGEKRKSNQYEVEKILDKQVDGLIVTYKVKWVGYKTPTWEAAPNLAGCKDLLKQFEKDYAKKMEKKEAASRRSVVDESTLTPNPRPIHPDLQKLILKEIPEGMAPVKIHGSSRDNNGELFFAVELKPRKDVKDRSDTSDAEAETTEDEDDEEKSPPPKKAAVDPVDDDKNVELITGPAMKKHVAHLILLCEYYEKHAVFLSKPQEVINQESED